MWDTLVIGKTFIITRFRLSIVSEAKLASHLLSIKLQIDLLVGRSNKLFNGLLSYSSLASMQCISSHCERLRP